VENKKMPLTAARTQGENFGWIATSTFCWLVSVYNLAVKYCLKGGDNEKGS
jgi:hypothetical protein